VHGDEIKTRRLRPQESPRAEVLTDRKGRQVAVERYPAAPREEAKPVHHGLRSKGDRRKADRSKALGRHRRPEQRRRGRD
jgi:hypothetical protein